MNRVTRIELLWRVDAHAGAWSRVESLIGFEAELVERALSLEHLSCCSFQAGYFVDIDGEPWSDESTVDEPLMTTCWFRALSELFDSARVGPTYGPWEESNLTWWRDGDVLTMEDLHHSGHLAMRRVAVPFRAFAEHIHGMGVSFRRLIQSIQAEANRRTAGSGLSLGELERLRTIGDVLPQEADFESLDKLGSRLRASTGTR